MTNQSQLLKIAEMLRRNGTVVAIMGVVMVLAFSTIVWLGMMCIASYDTFRRMTFTQKVDERKSNDDDERYKEEIKDVAPEDPEYTRIRQHVSRIERTYDKYNRELSRYTRNTHNVDPDALMDRTIISSDHDDYAYGKK